MTKPRVNLLMNPLFIVALIASMIALGFLYVTLRERLASSSSAQIASSLLVQPGFASGQASSARVIISDPPAGSSVNTDEGWLRLEGRILAAKPQERFYLLVQTQTDPSRLFVQQELMPDREGSWQAEAKFGSPGFTYDLFIVASQVDQAFLQLAQSEAGVSLPEHFELVSDRVSYFVE